MKKWIPIAAALVLSAALTWIGVMISGRQLNAAAEGTPETSILAQRAELTSQPHKTVKLYASGQLIGVVQDSDKIDQLLQEVYQQEYEADFPDTRLDLGEDVVVSQGVSYYRYENIDDQICDYLRQIRIVADPQTMLVSETSAGTVLSVLPQELAWKSAIAGMEPYAM